MTPEERKKALGFGGLSWVARKTKRTLGHVSQVNAGLRRDALVERWIARRIAERHPDLDGAAVFAAPLTEQTARVGAA